MLCRECGHAYDCEQTLIKALPETSAFPIVTTSTPTVTPTATSTPSPPAGVTPSATPTANPLISLNPPVSPQGSPAPSVLSTSMPDTDAAAEPSERSDLSIAGLRVRSGDNRHVTLSWSYNMSATGYEIYMSSGKNKTYRRIQTLSGQTLSYTYNKQKAGVRYRYKLRAWWTDGSRIVYGAFTKPQTITVTRLITPVISVQKKRAGSIPYLLLRV